MDIHRCRFVPYQPQAINALAFSHTSDPKQATPVDLKLALGRENGDIEIWNPLKGNWVQERVFRSGVGRTAEQVHWTQDLLLPDEDEESQKPERGSLRLFTSGGSKSITEWDIEKGVPKREADGNSDDIWCFAPQPQWTYTNIRNRPADVRAAPSQLIAAGCADGSIVLFSTADDDIRFDRVLTKRITNKSRCISLAWRDRNTVVAGFEENMIRVFDVRNRTVLRQMSLGKAREGSQVIVWTVKCLPNGTILSGDSSGELKIWDSENFSLVQTLKTHTTDVLDITTNHAGTMILTCGVDRRTVAYAPMASQPSQKTQRWHELRHRRFHEHDVKAITSFEGKTLSIAVSGGIDTVPVVLPLKNWDEEYHRSLSYLPQRPQMSVSASTRLMLTWWARDLLVWLLPHRYQESADTDSIPDDQSNHKLLAQIQLNGDEHITSAEICSSGNLILAATSTGVKLFQIRRTISTTGAPEVRSRPVDLPKMIASQGATTVGFTPDNKWLYAVRLNNVISMAKIVQPSSPKERPSIHERIVKLDRKKRKLLVTEPSAISDYSRHITTVAFSSDSRILAVGDLSGAIDTWILEGHEATPVIASQQLTNGVTNSDNSSQSASEDSDSDSEDETDSRVTHGQKWIRTPSGSQLPTLETNILALSFKPSSAPPSAPHHIQGNQGLHATRQTPHPVSPEHPAQESGYLIAITSSHQIIEFDTLNCKLSDWSRRNPSSLLPEKFRAIKDRVMGIWFDVRPKVNVSRLWLYGANFMYMLDLTRDFSASPGESGVGQKLIEVGHLGGHTLQVDTDHALVRTADGTNGDDSKKRKRGRDGAGDAMRDDQKYSVKIRRVGVEALDGRLISPPGSVDEMDVDVDEDGEDEQNQTSELAIRRRADAGVDQEESELENGDEKENGDHHENGLSQPTKKEKHATSWYTFQYRGIYGISVLQPEPRSVRTGDDEVNGKDEIQEQAPEIVIVERPMYDVELAPRFSSGQDW